MKIFPVIALIVGAMLTLTITLFIQWYNDRKKRKQTKEYLIYSIDILIANSKKTKDNLDELVKQLESKPVDIPILNIPIGFNVKSIEIVSFDDRFKIFVLKYRKGDKTKRAEYLNKFNNAIEIVRTTLIYAMDEINNLRKYDDNDKKTYNEYFHKMQEILNFKAKNMNTTITSSMVEFNPNVYIEQEKNKKLMLEITPVYTSFFKDKTTEALQDNIYVLYENLIIPIFNIAKKYNDLELMNFFPMMIGHCITMISTRESFTERFKQFFENVKLSIQYFEEVVTFLK